MSAEHAHLQIDGERFRQHFPGRQFRITHRLVDHPLFDMERLLRLALSLPRHVVEFYSGKAAVSQNPSTTPATGLSLEETIRKIHVANSWVVLKYCERDPDYRALLLECVDELRPHIERILPGTHQEEAFIFISSPGSTTPLHLDEEHNFLLQIRGSKQAHTWTPDRGGIDHRDLERYYLGGHRNVRLRDEIVPLVETFPLAPGQGVHIPLHGPHWVKNDDAVSISFSVTFRTARSAREASIHWLNGKLRRLGLSPRPPGKGLVGDAAKAWTARGARRMARRLRRVGVLR
jgi:ribosomal protein L16 Arg81 hydroxylase